MAGHFCSGSSIPASQVYNEEGILQISPASTNPNLTEQGFDNVFRTCGRDDVQGQFAANFVVDNKIASKIAILHDKTAYGKGLADEFKKQLNARGVEEVMYEAITAGDKDFTALITKLKEAGVDLIYLRWLSHRGRPDHPPVARAGPDAKLMSGDALVDKQYWEITGPTGEGTLMTFAPDPRKLPTASRSSPSSRPTITIPRATRSTPTRRSRPTPTRPRRPARPIPRRWPRRCARAATTRCWGRSPSTRRAT